MNNLKYKKTIVVTGASGFIGRSLIRELTGRGVNVIPVCRSRVNTEDFFIVDNYLDAPVGDVLIHLAELSDVSEVNEIGPLYKEQAIKTLKSLIEIGYGEVIYISSALVYGDAVNYKRTTDEILRPENTYCNSKLSCEKLVLANNRNSVVRLSNIYGPNMAINTIFSDIIKQKHNTEPLLVRDQSPVRDYIWIDDAVGGIADIALSDEAGIFNLGSGNSISVKELALTFLKNWEQHSRVVSSMKKSNRESTINLDISLTQKKIHWSPTTTLEKGLRILMENIDE